MPGDYNAWQRAPDIHLLLSRSTGFPLFYRIQPMHQDTINFRILFALVRCPFASDETTKISSKSNQSRTDVEIKCVKIAQCELFQCN